MWTYGVVLARPGFDENLGFSQGVEDLSVQELVVQPRVEALDVSILPGRTWLDEGGPGADRGDPAPATNSGPLSERIQAGIPRRMKRSVRTSLTSTEENLRRTRIARLSRVNSSRTLRVRKARPSWIR